MLFESVDFVKGFMGMLLKGSQFDNFMVRLVEIKTFVRFEIDGYIKTEEAGSYILWSELRPYVLNIIKGQTLPESIKIVLSLSPEKTEKIHSNAKALFLNILYEEGAIKLFTGCALKDFALDKTVEQSFDEYIRQFLITNEIKTTVLE